MKKTELQNLALKMGIDSKTIDSIILKETELTKTQLFLTPIIGDEYIKNILDKLAKLKSGIPIEYLVENAEFYSLDFFVDKRVLIPRDDSEIMVDKAIDKALEMENITLIDIGTGTSCIPISINLNSSKIENTYVIDISNKALEVSKKNIFTHNLEKHIKQVKSDLLSEIVGDLSYKINKNVIITANLPYIKDEDYENIDKETLEFEPALALYGGPKTGFELYETLIHQAINLKKTRHISKIILFIEIGFDQKDYSKKYLVNLNLKHKFYKDTLGINRCIEIEI